MPYLITSDYTLRISVLHLNEILTEGAETSGLTEAQVQSNAESWARALMKSYLVTKYDITGEFALPNTDTPTPRNRQIMQILIDLSLCTLHKTINPRNVPEHISASCDAAMAWLKEARDGTIVLDLPAAPVLVGETAYADQTFLGSQQKFISKPFTDQSLFQDPIA